jgi:P-aminobenzoate N-oxygenase AurF
MFTTTQKLDVTTAINKDYRSPFKRWDEISWIRSKPMREDAISGLPFSPELVPLASHQAIATDANRWMTVLAYRLLAHLQFTTLLELNHVNPVCSALAQGRAPVSLNTDQRNDALRIYCDEGGHALFVEKLSTKVEETFGLDHSVIGRPQFERTLDRLLSDHQDRISPNLIKFFFVSISETLVTSVLNDVPSDPRVSSVVRDVIGDHAADEALHSVYFRHLFPMLWHHLSPYEKEEMGQLLPQLVWAFLGPDRQYEYNILRHLGFNREEAEGILEEVYVSKQVAAGVKLAAKPTLKMFESCGVFSRFSIQQAFADNELL